ncbi:MAG: hypothetical protein Q4C47_08280 [Planctomycetia bacterium]|nr:hypothetical protein [Planctomycetia bacterium]
MRFVVADEDTEKTPDEQLAFCASHGLPYIGLFRSHFTGEDGLPRGDEDVAAMLLDTGVRCATLGWAGGFTGIDCNAFGDRKTGTPPPQCSFRYAVEDAAGALRTAAILGAKQLLLRCGPPGTHIRRHAVRLFFEAVKELLPVAEDMEVILALGELGPLDLFPERAFPWFSIMNSWVGLVIDLEYWGNPESLPFLDRHIGRLARHTTLIRTGRLTVRETWPLLDRFAKAGYHGDIQIPPEFSLELVTGSGQKAPRSTVL